MGLSEDPEAGDTSEARKSAGRKGDVRSSESGGGSGLSPPGRGNPKYGNPKYGNPKYGNPKYGNPKYGNPKYGNPKYGNPKYGNPKADLAEAVLFVRKHRIYEGVPKFAARTFLVVSKLAFEPEAASLGDAEALRVRRVALYFDSLRAEFVEGEGGYASYGFGHVSVSGETRSEPVSDLELGDAPFDPVQTARPDEGFRPFQKQVHPEVFSFDELDPSPARAFLGAVERPMVMHPRHPRFEFVERVPNRREEFRAVAGGGASYEESLGLEAVREVFEDRSHARECI